MKAWKAFWALFLVLFLSALWFIFLGPLSRGTLWVLIAWLLAAVFCGLLGLVLRDRGGDS